MAKRINVNHEPQARQRIKVSLLLKRLMDHANNKVEMTQTQVKAAEILLKKSLPDLSAMQHSNDPENPMSPILSLHDADLITRYLAQKEKP